MHASPACQCSRVFRNRSSSLEHGVVVESRRLHMPSHWGADMVRLLLAPGANPKGSGSFIQYSMALYETICSQELEILRLLIQYGADVNARGCYGDTALYHLCRSGK